MSSTEQVLQLSAALLVHHPIKRMSTYHSGVNFNRRVVSYIVTFIITVPECRIKNINMTRYMLNNSASTMRWDIEHLPVAGISCIP